MSERTIEPNEKHKAFFDEMKEIFAKHAAQISSEELLALSAYYTGMVLALQNQKTMTPDRGLAIISRNIELGNAFTIGEVFRGIGEGKH